MILNKVSIVILLYVMLIKTALYKGDNALNNVYLLNCNTIQKDWPINKVSEKNILSITSVNENCNFVK